MNVVVDVRRKDKDSAPAGEVLPVRLLRSHVALALVLAKFRELDGDDAPDRIATLLHDVPGVLDAFAAPGAFATSFTKTVWDEWFSGSGRGGGRSDALRRRKSTICSVYELRSFYGLENPNNLAQRFDRHLMTLSPAGATAPDVDKLPAYERAILAWGKYAEDVVAANGGAADFFLKESLADIRDVRPTKGTWGVALRGTGADRESLVQRMLYLLRDRYVQILAAPVSVMWPVWLVADTKVGELLDRAEQVVHPTTARSAREAALYVDLNPVTTELRGFPYPFGFAADALDDSVAELPWPAELVQQVSSALARQRWTPPLLLGTRGDFGRSHGILQAPRSGDEQRVATLITLSDAVENFATYYVRRDFLDDRNCRFDALHIAFEKKTWAERVLADANVRHEAFGRSEFEANYTVANAAFTYFPADMCVAQDHDYVRVDEYGLIQRFGVNADSLRYLLPRTVLASGVLLPQQPAMRRLLIDVADRLRLLRSLFNAVRPDWDQLRPLFRAIRRADIDADGLPRPIEQAEADRRAIARKISTICESTARVQTLEVEGLAHDQLEQWMKAVGTNMLKAMTPHCTEEQQKRALDRLHDWRWTELLEAGGSTAIYVSLELF